MLEKYLSQVNLILMKNFMKILKLNIPENFNFAFDIVDEIAVKPRIK